jgi:RimJ/RimL family protein N-acetyltransferase
VTLSGRLVRLEPLSPGHAADLAEAGRDEEVWRLMPYGPVTTEAAMAEFIRSALGQASDRPFAVVHAPTGRAVGSTRYLDIRPAHRGLEIGGTWYAPAHQRTGVNTECKYLLLRHAFEALGCIRVQLKTDQRNERSQRAIERLGAVREGVLRNHVIMPDGYRRATVMYSITDEEWPGVRARLERLIARDDGPAE